MPDLTLSLSYSYFMNVSLPRLRCMFSARKKAEATTRTWMAVNALGLVLSLCAIGGFYSNIAHGQQISLTDANQNAAIATTNQRLDDLQKDRDSRIAEANKKNALRDEAIASDHDRLTHDEAWAIGFFAALGAVQSFGLFKTIKHTKQ